MAEEIVWSRTPALGYLKHPPFSAMVVKVWFTIFPLADWSYYLLSISIATLSLWIAWRLAGDFLPAEKRVAGLALLTLVPFFNFHALKYNVNTVLMPLWAATTFWFLRSYLTQKSTYAALAGIGAAACLYDKYWSLCLLLGLAVAALVHPARGRYFQSLAPWITASLCVAIMIPQVVWLIGDDFQPFHYAFTVHKAESIGDAVTGALHYLVYSLLYVALPLSLALLLSRQPGVAAADMAWPATPVRQLVAAAFWTPLLSPVIVVLTVGVKLSSLWSMSMWTLLPVMLLSPPAITIAPWNGRKILALTTAVPIVSLLASPAVAIIVHRMQRLEPTAVHAQLLAKQVEEAWVASSGQSLRFIDGITNLANGVAAYAKDRPRALAGVPVNLIEVVRGGKAVVCYAGTQCARDALTAALQEPENRLIYTTITRN